MKDTRPSDYVFIYRIILPRLDVLVYIWIFLRARDRQIKRKGMTLIKMDRNVLECFLKLDTKESI